MDFLVNEWSLHGQYASERDFKQSFNLILSCQHEIEKHGHSCYYSRQLNTRKVMPRLDLKQVVKKTGDRNFIQQVVNLLSKRGPFWPDNRRHSEDDYFAYQNEVVTNTAIAEAAWCVANYQQDCHTVSFKPSDFNYSPLSVVWHQLETNLHVKVQNFWEVNTLTTFLKTSIKPPTTWEELIQQCIKDYPHLTFADDLLNSLDSQPFSEVISRKVSELLSILDKLNACMLKNDEESKKERDNIMADYFSDIKKPLFKDSSSTEKNKPIFRQRMTFKKPGSTTGETIECRFHGVITHRQYRIHFSWPKKQPTDPLYIVYIGPKLTKR